MMGREDPSITSAINRGHICNIFLSIDQLRNNVRDDDGGSGSGAVVVPTQPERVRGQSHLLVLLRSGVGGICSFIL